MGSIKNLFSVLSFCAGFPLLFLGIAGYYTYLHDYYDATSLQNLFYLRFIPFAFVATLITAILMNLWYRKVFQVGIFWYFWPYLLGLVLLLMSIGLEKRFLVYLDLQLFNRWEGIVFQVLSWVHLDPASGLAYWIVFLSYGLICLLLAIPTVLLLVTIHFRSVVGGWIITALCGVLPIYLAWVEPYFHIL